RDRGHGVLGPRPPGPSRVLRRVAPVYRAGLAWREESPARGGGGMDGSNGSSRSGGTRPKHTNVSISSELVLQSRCISTFSSRAVIAVFSYPTKTKRRSVLGRLGEANQNPRQA